MTDAADDLHRTVRGRLGARCSAAAAVRHAAPAGWHRRRERREAARKQSRAGPRRAGG